MIRFRITSFSCAASVRYLGFGRKGESKAEHTRALDARGGNFDSRVSLEKQVEDEDYEHTDRILSQHIEESNSKLEDSPVESLEKGLASSRWIIGNSTVL